jgi:hypothetical protein
MCTFLHYEESSDFFKVMCVYVHYITLEKCAENTLIMELFTNPVKQQKSGDLILSNISIFKPMSLPEAGSFTLTACIWNVAIYTAGTK